MYAPYYPTLQREQWFVILSEDTYKQVVFVQEIKDLKPSVRNPLLASTFPILGSHCTGCP